MCNCFLPVASSAGGIKPRIPFNRFFSFSAATFSNPSMISSYAFFSSKSDYKRRFAINYVTIAINDDQRHKLNEIL